MSNFSPDSPPGGPDFGAAVIDTVAALVTVLDRDGCIVLFNRACERLTGYTFEEVRGMPIWEILLMQEEIPAVRQVFESLRSGLFPNQARNYWRTKDGRRRFIQWTNTALAGPSGLVEYVVATGIDITESQILAAQQQASLARLDSLIQVSQQVLAESNVEGLLNAIVEAARALTGARVGVAGHQFQDGEFIVGASSSVPDSPACPPDGIFKIERGGVYQELLGDRNILRLTDEELRNHPAWRGLPEGHGPLNGLLASRLIDHTGSASGLIMVSDKCPSAPDLKDGECNEFTVEDEALLGQLAAMASLGYQHIQARSDAEQRAEELNTVINSMTEGVGIFDEQGELLQSNPAMHEIFGYDPGSFYSGQHEPRLDFRHLDGSPMSISELPSRQAMAGKTIRNFPVLFTNINGRQFSLLSSAAPVLYQGRHQGAVLILHDISDVRDAEEALRRSESRLRRLVESNLIGIYYSTLDGKVIGANQAFLQMVSCSAEELAGGSLRIQDITPTEYWLQDETAQAEAQEQGASSSYEKEFIRPDGLRVPVMVGSASLEGGPGELISYVVDLTERKQAQDALNAYARRLERSNRDLQDFAFIASHDLQEPLRKIQSFSNRLMSAYADQLDTTALDYLQRMQSAAERMQGMVNDLLTYSRVTTQGLPFSPVDMNQVLEDVLSDLEVRIEQTNGRVETGRLPRIDADPSQMHQLFMNLVNNALKFHRPGISPVVKVKARQVSLNRVEISVEDNGIGFEEIYLERIFLPFQRLNPRDLFEGSGIGLAICRKIVERHGGSISATSRLGEGTCFLIQLPLQQARPGD